MIKDDPHLYGSRTLELPTPLLIVLYNGTDDFPAEKTFKLSVAYKNKGIGKIIIDAEVRVININKGVNPELERRSKTLADYASFIAKVREYEKDYASARHPLKEAIKSACKYCIENDILKEYLRENVSGVIDMLTAEFKMDEVLKVIRMEGVEEGIEKGIKKGMEKGQDYVLKLMEQGLSYEQIKKKIKEEKSKKYS
jgi:hypothetical protein